MHKFLKILHGMAAIAVVSAVAMTVAHAQNPGGKNFKDTAEFDLYNAVAKDLNGNNFAQAITDLDTWKSKYAESEYKDDRTVFYIQAYTGAKQPGKAVDTAADIINKGVDTVFADPKTGPSLAIKALFSTVFAVTQVPDPTPDQLAIGNKAAHALLDYNRKPEGVSDADWNKARTEQLQPPAKAALLHIAMLPGNQAFGKKDWPACEAAYAKALEQYQENAALAYQLGACMYSQRDKPEKRAAGVYEFQRAVALDPTLGGTADAAKIKAYAESTYVNLHGSNEGLEELRAAAKGAPMPPANFKIKTATEIAEEKQAEFEKSNPQLALWMKIKGALADTNGEQYFAGQLKDSSVPTLRGTLVDAKPACRPKELLVAVPLPDAKQPLPVEIVLKLDAPLTGKPEANSEFHWSEAIPTAFVKDPFMLTMTVDKAKLEGLKTSPCTAAPTGAKKSGPGKKKG